ncbi:polysaccharide biosynthesis protein [Marinobacter bryozoorum]|uniref:polysaccharide biosynthesis protein n=1 Tax=Marinobacter bryozoorum TaxID=256324 RepID=UPI002002E0A1|nr:polysaccharide biosynthesis protein [Marinobacter bryozoorum]MCK7544021.1 polysaccharide biosynthesis protein [Marinobacter bryozoorum]
MDNNKLYNALLKTQERQKAERATHAHPEAAERAETAPPSSANGSRLESAFLKEAWLEQQRHSTRAEPAGQPVSEAPPNWTMVEEAEDDHPPSLYDSSISLDLINNPRPWSLDELRDRKIIYSGMPNKAILDAFREIRIKLRDRAGAVNFSVLVSSLGKSDNSALTAYNLAATFAMDAQSSALLVDCNPWDRDLDNLVSSSMGRGVTDFVADKSVKVKDIIYPSGIDRLSVVPPGTQASSAVELFSAVRMRDLMGELKSRYPDRFLIINAPPLKASTEAHILVRYANQVVLGVPFGEVTPEEIVASVETLGSEKFSGLIFQQ